MIGTSLIASGRVPTTIGTTSLCSGSAFAAASYMACSPIGGARRVLERKEILRGRAKQAAQALAEDLFQKIPGGPEEALEGFKGRTGVFDQFDRLVERDLLGRRAQRPGDQRTQRPGVFGVLDRPQEAGADR